MIHFFYCPFTGLGLRGGYRGDEWLNHRITIFKVFVLRSLMNLEGEKFVLWISWRPEDETNPIVLDFYTHLKQIRGLRVIFTFHGIMFWDDKYTDGLAERRLRTAFNYTLPELKEIVGEAETVYMTIQPSDDMYLTPFTEAVEKRWPDETDVMAFHNGYIMDYGTKEIAEYNPDTQPPFYTIRFSRETFLDPEKHYDFTGAYKSHEWVGAHMRLRHWKQRGFVVGTHGENISTVYNHPYRGKVLSLSEREAVMIKTGILFADPVKINRSRRLLARALINVLPFQDSLRKFYHTLNPKYQIF